MRSIRATAVAAGALLALITAPSPAAADDLIVIPVSGFASGSEGETTVIASVAVPDDLIGATCQITGSTVNQVSVHDGNDLLITTNGQTFVVPNFEDAGFIVHEAGETASIGATIDLAIRFGPDGLSSGGFRVSVDCDPNDAPETTTTTMAPTTTAPPTTAAPETTTAAPTTTAPTTTAPTTTAGPDTTAVPSTDVGANPPTSETPPSGPTTAPPSTTTAAPTTAAVPPVTAAEEPPQGPNADGGGSLPVTGSSSSSILGLGLGIVVLGALMRRLAVTTS